MHGTQRRRPKGGVGGEVPGVDQLGTPAECIDMLFAAGCDAATIISRHPS